MEEMKKGRGGKREGAGRKKRGNSTTAMSLKLDNDLFAAINNPSFQMNKNRFINEAVRQRLIDEGLL